MLGRTTVCGAIGAPALGLHCALASLQAAELTHFEARQTHALAITPDGRWLVGVNSPEGRLSVFDVSSPQNPEPVLEREVAVGLEPVAVTVGDRDEVWVVNEVSDSVSVVSLNRGLVTDTIPVGDEPSDVVLSEGRAFVSCAGSRELRVFDAASHAPIATVPLEGVRPSSLAVDGARRKIYVAFLLSGNRTTSLASRLAPPQPAPVNPELPAPPHTARIVSALDPAVPYRLVDHDVAVVDLRTLRVESYLGDIGTTLFDITVSPDGSGLWVAHTDANNLTAFETNLRGHVVDHRLTRVGLNDGLRTEFELNPGVDYSLLPNPKTQATALSHPAAVAFSHDGSGLWVAAFGSDRIARLATGTGVRELVVEMRAPGANLSRAPAGSVRGPRALALHPLLPRLYVLNKLSDTLGVIDTGNGGLMLEVDISSHDALSAEARVGRGVLIDARRSGNGLASCASCHLDADRDGLAWDLGDPAGGMAYVLGADFAVHDTNQVPRPMHPMKGPMMTQTLRGLTPGQRLHWRGDRPDIASFNATFVKLLGGSLAQTSDMEALATYLAGLRHHPNPNLNEDGTLPALFNGGNPARGSSLFAAHINHCQVCHTGPTGSDDNIDDFRNFGGLQPIKTAPLATVYQRALMVSRAGATNYTGFGLLHDGTGGAQALPTVHFYDLDSLSGTAFADVAAFVLCFDTGTAPVVGRGMTISATNGTGPDAAARFAVLAAQASASNRCDLVARGVWGGNPCGFRFRPEVQRFQPDRSSAPWKSFADLAAEMRPGDSVTLLAVPSGQGVARGVDREGEGTLDGDLSPPELQVIAHEGMCDILWPRSRLGWVLEFCSSLGDAWMPESSPRDSAGDIHESMQEHRFYRFRRTW